MRSLFQEYAIDRKKTNFQKSTRDRIYLISNKDGRVASAKRFVSFNCGAIAHGVNMVTVRRWRYRSAVVATFVVALGNISLFLGVALAQGKIGRAHV